MVQTNVEDGSLEAQKQSLLNSSLRSRSAEAGSPGAFPHLLPVSSVSSLDSYEENPGKSTHPFTGATDNYGRAPPGCECRGKGESDPSAVLVTTSLIPDANPPILFRGHLCSVSAV
jgi:hypothetical protein